MLLLRFALWLAHRLPLVAPRGRCATLPMPFPVQWWRLSSALLLPPGHSLACGLLAVGFHALFAAARLLVRGWSLCPAFGLRLSVGLCPSALRARGLPNVWAALRLRALPLLPTIAGASAVHSPVKRGPFLPLPWL